MEEVNLDNQPPCRILETLGKLFESSREQCDLKRLMTSIEIAYSVNIENFDMLSQATYYYFLGNAWSYVQQIKYPKSNFGFESEEIEKQVTYYRKSLGLLKDNRDDLIKCQVLTNLGNLFSHIGRTVESQEYFNSCLDINPKFGMAIGNRGFGLFHYARLIYDPTLQFIFLQYAHKDLLEACKMNDVYLDAKNDFYSFVKYIETVYSAEKLKVFRKYDNYYKGLTVDEVDYRIWCSENKLFINPLNDVLTCSVVANDYLCTPSMVLKDDKKSIYQSMFNQIKQEYVSARFLFYESITSYCTHFSDKQVTLMETLDNSIYSLSIEKMKISFRACYSIFDKIAYFIFIYLNLGKLSNRINFRTIWCENLEKNQGLNKLISNSENWALRGLFWLSKDLYERDFDETIEPEAKELAKIRNFIEHKSFKVVDSFNSEWIKQTETYEIDRELFEHKTLKILKLSRSALMYLSYMIYEEESKRKVN